VTALLVVLGAAVGAPCRWLLDRYVQGRTDAVMPWGTFSVNVLGSALLGVLVAAHTLGPASAAAVALLGTGFAGAFTTFSTFAWETFRLVEEGAPLVAAVNVAASLAAGLVAAVTGWLLGVAVWG